MIWCDWYDSNKRKINTQILTTVKQLLVMVKSVLYEGTIALGTGVDFGKGLGRSEPWGNYCGSGWRKETVETKRQDQPVDIYSCYWTSNVAPVHRLAASRATTASSFICSITSGSQSLCRSSSSTSFFLSDWSWFSAASTWSRCSWMTVSTQKFTTRGIKSKK